jgi:hypothetical protein
MMDDLTVHFLMNGTKKGGFCVVNQVNIVKIVAFSEVYLWG